MVLCYVLLLGHNFTVEVVKVLRVRWNVTHVYYTSDKAQQDKAFHHSLFSSTSYL